ncbi:TolC family protein [Niabella drilacis]|uniref:Outer membrane protein TolC n=1 Tax=Niabella drilacis (strain DSM 25811 / CCM 8410 / CCUG 62505 / LMG 26954 / E90) TaxID=1285928 RepID=A0A1G6IKY7_NIADE|nr:TolC family protein [Niabella drilacis]SDC07070.1 Outer membrane protein TolC [Niabella drilacis]
MKWNDKIEIMEFTNCRVWGTGDKWQVAGDAMQNTGSFASCLLRTAFCMLFFFCAAATQAQHRISVSEAIDTALRNNLQLDINRSEISRAGYAVKTAQEIPKTGVFAENEDLRPSDNKGVLKIGISQSMAWPGLYKARKAYLDQQLKYYRLNTPALSAVLRKEVRSVYYELWYLEDKFQLFKRLDSIYTSLYKAAELRFKTGEAAGLDKIAANAKLKELQALLEQNGKDMVVQQQQLMLLLNKNEWLLPVQRPLEKLGLLIGTTDSLHPSLALQQQNVDVAASNIAVQKNGNKPEFSGRVFTQRLWGAKDPYTGFSVTAAFPLFGNSAYKSRIKVARAEMEIQQKQLSYQTLQVNTQRQTALTEIEKNLAMLQFYETTGLKQADEIIKAATLSYKAGEISFAELSQFLTQAIDTQKNYLDVLNQYNQSVIQFYYYNNH